MSSKRSGGPNNDELQRYVLKQSWRPTESKPEQFLYGKVQDPDDRGNLGKIYSYEDVLVEGGPGLFRKDCTHLNRHEVQEIPLAIVSETDQTTGKRPRDEEKESRLHVQTTAGVLEPMPESRRLTHHRVLSRLLLETYGCPIKFFKDITELLIVLRDAIRGSSVLCRLCRYSRISQHIRSFSTVSCCIVM